MKMNKFLFLGAISASLFFSSCSSDDDNINVEASTNYENGVFVLNEGNFGKNNSTVSFIDEGYSSITNNIFSNVNNEDMGDTGQSMEFYNDYALIVMNASNILQIVNKNTFELVYTVEGDLNNPRHVAAYNGKAYVTNAADFSLSDDDYVAIIDLETFEVENKIIAGTKIENIEEDNGLIYIQGSSFGDGNSIHVLDPSSNTISYTYTTNVGLRSFDISNSNLIAISDTQLQVFDINSKEALSTIDFPEDISGTKFLEIEDGIVYFVSGKSVYAISENNLELPDEPLFSMDEVNTLYAFDVEDDMIWTGDAKDYASAGAVRLYSLSGELMKQFTTEISPNGFYFND
ncbi:MAG: DUF5074 domain-containing protein [Zunongwangia sp.]|uniref:DUF5074 domain-containing protein n=1 Tax=Zunongwangia TaxID=417127 RepID=UPI000C8F1BC9|nr:quinoprotein amine dehydrogenase [Flavobacteriaceae bacterium]